MFGLFFFFLLFLLTEFRKRADVFILSEKQIEKRSFFGIAYAQHFDLIELDGFTEMEYYSKSIYILSKTENAWLVAATFICVIMTKWRRL